MTSSKCLPREAIKRPKKFKKNAYKGFQKKERKKKSPLKKISHPVITYRKLVKNKDFGLES